MSSNELKRVGLIFTEEGAVDFKKTLQEVNLELNKNYNQFKLTQAQWDNSTKSTEKLRAQQEYLKNAYEIQTDKVNILKKQLIDLENAEEKDATAIKKKRNELTAAEVKLEAYNKQIKDLENRLTSSGKKMEEWGEKAQKNGEKIEKVGKKVSAFSLAVESAFVASAKSAIDFEDAFTGVEKTVNETVNTSFVDLKQAIRDMAKEIPSTTTEIAAVAEAAGQLGIGADDILSFTRVMLDLGNSTNLSAEEAASSLAKFANIMDMSKKDFDRLGSSIVDLGNNFATTEADIVDMAMRLAGAGKQVGLSEGQVLGLATALSSVGIEAEMGGSAISKAMVKMQNAVEQGGTKLNNVLDKTGMSLRELELLSANNSKDFKALADDIGMTSTELNQLITAGTNLEDFAKISGMTAEEFKKAWKEDAAGALSVFIKGLGDAENKGESAITMLSEMGLTEVRLRDSLLRAANAGDLFTEAISTGTKAWEDNTALTNEANKRYENLKSKITMAINKIKDVAITLGTKLMPEIEDFIGWIEKVVKWLDKLDDEQLDFVLKIGMIITALGPAITIFGKLQTTLGTVVKGFGALKLAMEVTNGTATSTSIAVNGLSKVFSAVTSPVGSACLVITAAVATIAVAVNKASQESKRDFETMGNSANDFITGIDNATSHLNSFNSEIFASSQEQQELSSQMDEIQAGITNICKTASDERRGYTQEEITQLDEYFQKLRELNQREIEIQNEIAGAITQQAATNAEIFQGSLEEYKQQSQEWIKTAQEQKDKTLELIKTQTTEEIALLNQRYGDQANMQNENYANEYNRIMEEQQKKIDAANDEVSKVSEAYTNGYAQRLLQNEDFKARLEEYNKKVEEENQRHSNRINKINSDTNNSEYMLFKQRENEGDKHFWKMKSIQDELYKGMSDSEADQLGVLIGMASNTELYGGKIESETQNTVDTVINSYDSMPSRTREAMKNAMSPMLVEMQNAEPGLFAKAGSIADGIIARLKKAFDEHSPSKKTRKIMKFAMEPMQEEMENGKKELFKEADEIGNGVTDRLNNIEGNTRVNAFTHSSNFSNNMQSSLIDYNKMADAFLNALNKCRLTLDEDGFAKIVKDEIYKVV